MSDSHSTQQRLAKCTNALGGSVVLIALTAIAGWVFDVEALKSVLPGAVTMKINTALGLLFAGSALRGAAPCRSASYRLMGRVCATIIVTLGALTLAEYITGWDGHFDNFIYPESPGANATAYPGRMAPQSATCFCLFGIAFVLSSIQGRWQRVVSQMLNAITALIALASLAGHLYGAVYFYGIARFDGIALHTAVSFLALCAALYCSQHETGAPGLFFGRDLGGLIARRLLPAAILVPFVLGWLRGRGQALGLYDTATGVALLVMLIILFLAVMVGYTAKMVNRLDLAREEAQAARDRSNEKLQEALEEVGTLRGLLPMCSWCKSVRDDSGYWGDVSDYIAEHTEAVISHGICPVCARQHFPAA